MVAKFYSTHKVVFENGALRRILGPKRDEVIGEWRKFHFYSSKSYQ
jgi:hypothetical protein